MKLEDHPPLPLCIVGGIFVYLGVYSTVDMILAVFLGGFRFDITFALLFVGYGMLKGRQSSRLWGIVWSSLATALFLVMIGFAWYSLIKGGQLKIPFQEKHPHAYTGIVAVATIFYLSLAVFSLVVLVRKKYRKWFTRKERPAGIARCIALPVAIASVLSASFTGMIEYEIQQELGRARVVSTEIVPVDAATNEALESVTWAADTEEVMNVIFPISRSSGTHDKHGMHHTGVAFSPREITLQKDGYRNETVILDRTTQDVIRVPLHPIETVATDEQPP